MTPQVADASLVHLALGQSNDEREVQGAGPGPNRSQYCAAANEGARSERGEIQKRKLITKAVLCDTSPPCATEVLFSHELYWPKNPKVPPPELAFRGGRPSRCRTWADSDWPTFEPHLSRATTLPRPRGFWDTLQLLPNRTLWLHGDSIQLQMCDAALCSLMRAGVAPEPALQLSVPHWLRKLSEASGFNFLTSIMPNGARLICSGIGPFQLERVKMVLPHVDVAVLNFGLHYHTVPSFRAMLESALGSLSAWQHESPRTRVALWREGSAQHFRRGSYRRGDEKRQGSGQPCTCTALSETNAEKATLNLNVEAWRLENALVPSAGVGLVPFFNLTAPRHDMHRRHFCAFAEQKTPGRCCDCTHFCYTPLFWDAVFGGLYRATRHSTLGKLALSNQVLGKTAGVGRRVPRQRVRKANGAPARPPEAEPEAAGAGAGAGPHGRRIRRARGPADAALRTQS